MKQTLLITLIAILIWNCNSDKSKQINQQNNNKIVNKLSIDTSGYSLETIDNLHERLRIRDNDLSLLDFIKSNPNKVDSIRKVVYLLPFGNMKPEVEKIIESEVEYLKAFFQLEVKVLEKISFDSIKKMTSIKTRLDSSFDFNN